MLLESQAPTSHGQGTLAAVSLMFAFRRDGSQVLEKDGPGL